MTATHTSYARTPWWEHTTTTTADKPCEDQPTTTSTPAPTTTSTVVEQPTTTSTTVEPEQPTTTVETTTTVELPTTTVEVPAPQHRFELTPAGNPPEVEHPNAIHVAVSTPLPVVDAVTVELAPAVSYANPTLPHTGSETAVTAGIGGLLVAVGLICTALAARTRKANR